METASVGIYRVVEEAQGEKVVYAIGTRFTGRYEEAPRRVSFFPNGHAECDGPDCYIDCRHLEIATR